MTAVASYRDSRYLPQSALHSATQDYLIYRDLYDLYLLSAKLKERQFSFIDDGWVEKYVPVQAIDDVKKELLGDTDA